MTAPAERLRAAANLLRAAAEALPARILNRIRVDPDTGCWEWGGAHSTTGYSLVQYEGRLRLGHRLVYEATVGPIPEGLTLDHLCRNRGCLNPSHLEPVTGRENTLRGEGATAMNARKGHCPQGHPYAGDNLLINAEGGRVCRVCSARNVAAYRARKPEHTCEVCRVTMLSHHQRRHERTRKHIAALMLAAEGIVRR